MDHHLTLTSMRLDPNYNSAKDENLGDDSKSTQNNSDIKAFAQSTALKERSLSKISSVEPSDDKQRTLQESTESTRVFKPKVTI